MSLLVRYLSFVCTYINVRELNVWWIDQMIGNLYGLREKMTLFWRGHFVVEATVVKVAQLLYIYNDMLRRNALGNFRIFVKEMYKDPAMLINLNGLENDNRHPNENFARGLLELFTMGVDNYTNRILKKLPVLLRDGALIRKFSNQIIP